MKYIVIGAGGVGSEIARDLAKVKETKLVSVADYHLKKAENLAKELGGKGKAIHVDVFDEKLLKTAIKGHDVVINATGPFFRTVKTIVQACIDEKINYVDIADDSSAVEILLEYDDACKNAEITAVICAGASPGTTNMFGLYGSQQLDETDEIHTNWVVSTEPVMTQEEAKVGATLLHAVEMSTGTNPQFIDGEMIRVPSATGEFRENFADALMDYPIYFVGHGEPITLSKNIPGVKTVTNRGNLYPESEGILPYKVFEHLRLTDKEPLIYDDIEINRHRLIEVIVEDMVKKRVAESSPEERYFESKDCQFIVRVQGRKAGKDTEYIFYWTDTMNPATALPASFAAQCVAKKTKNIHGVLAPEAYLDPKPFFAYLESRGKVFYEAVIIEGQARLKFS